MIEWPEYPEIISERDRSALSNYKNDSSCGDCLNLERENNAIDYRQDFTRDQQGNIIERLLTTLPKDGDAHQMKTTFEIDQDGWVIRQVDTIDGEPSNSWENTIEKNSAGQVEIIESRSEGGWYAESTYSYHDNGMMKKIATKSSGSKAKSSYEIFDEKGYRIEQGETDSDGNSTAVRYKWVFDSKGAPVERMAIPVGDTDLSSKYGIPEVSKVVLDSNGKIAEYQHENGEVIEKLTWVKVENPSDYVRLESALIR